MYRIVTTDYDTSTADQYETPYKFEAIGYVAAEFAMLGSDLKPSLILAMMADEEFTEHLGSYSVQFRKV